MDIKDNYNQSFLISHNDFISMWILPQPQFHISMHFAHAVPIAWQTLLQLANFHLSFKTQMRFTLILEFTLCFSVLPGYSLYILVACSCAIVLHVHLLYLAMSRHCPCLQLLSYLSLLPQCHVYINMYTPSI